MNSKYFITDIKKSGKSVKKFDGEKKYIATADVNYDKIVSYEIITFDNKPSRANVEVKVGDVLVAKMAGSIKVLVIDETNCEYIYSTGFYCFRSNDFLPEYLKFYFLSNIFNYYKDVKANGATQRAICDDDMKKLSLMLISKEEQKNIISKLNRIESIIEKNIEQNVLLTEYISTLFAESFGNPIYGDKYELEPLKDNCKIITGNTPSRKIKEYYGDYIEWIKSDNIFDNDIFPSRAAEYLSLKGEKVGRTIDKNCLMMVCIAGSIKSIGRICMTDRKVAFNQQINGIIPINYNPIFLYYILKENKKYIRDGINMALKGILSKSMLENKQFICPPIEEQDAFCERINLINSVISKNKLQIECLQTLLSSKSDEYFN